MTDADTDALNQPTPLGSRNLYAEDTALVDYVDAYGGDGSALNQFGVWIGSEDAREAGRLANRHAPELALFDRGGRRLDEVRFHPAYHQLLTQGLSAGYAAAPWEGAAGGHLTHAAMVYLQSQTEPATACPMTMTYAAVPALTGPLGDLWRPKLISRTYDPTIAPVSEKAGATMGMAMTEKQGGSDVRANTTRAEPDGEGYRLYGHKWFCSAPMSDGFLTLAQAPGGLTCFLVARWLPDGTRNGVHLMRLKEKLGNRANASAEIEYHGAWAERLGEKGDGVRQIIRMVHHTRLDTALAPVGLMRAALTEAHWWCAGRTVFQRHLIDQPLMRTVLADLALEWEGALALGMRVAAAFDRDDEAPFARIAVGLAKFLNNKRCPNVIYEAMECLGGMGYTDDTPLPMLYREAPLNSIWEGSGNVICLDILRTLARDPDAGAALFAEVEASKGAYQAYDTALKDHRNRWAKSVPEDEARLFAERTSTLLAAAILIRHAPSAVADAYVKTRVAGGRGHVAGAASALDTDALIARLAPASSF
ncbi:acyl-CoA dehydrogenase family protein [Aliiroseovarius sp. YM-037]|uniref:acyl-CoA dehydrogenase family protein n=1 Tax=Aliiroseovarius sp. YM-037 TaxID=3341728 RepID=UPI003A7FD109